jgi:hypothetical protein
MGGIDAKALVVLCPLKPGQRSGTAARRVLETLRNLVGRPLDVERLTGGEQHESCLLARGHGYARRD